MSEIMARFDGEVAQYDLENLVPSGDGFWAEDVAANWKCVRDVDNEGYHVPLAHPGLHDLFGSNYHDEPFIEGTARSVGAFREGDGRLWSVKNYKKILQAPDALDDTHKKAWLYIGVFPNLVFGLYPDSVIFYHEFPVENGKTIQRGASYKHANEDRRMRLSRYLSMRIDRLTSKEDEQLIQWTWEAAFSSGYDGIILSDLEYGVHSYHNALREHFPVLMEDEPPTGMLAKTNKDLLQAKCGEP
jgi:phenylpropionate dioxygenase-like ring-hydroxylating dioxygenase large terminal subunit